MWSVVQLLAREDGSAVGRTCRYGSRARSFNAIAHSEPRTSTASRGHPGIADRDARYGRRLLDQRLPSRIPFLPTKARRRIRDMDPLVVRARPTIHSRSSAIAIVISPTSLLARPCLANTDHGGAFTGR
ncbi:hypothetical protein RHA1_ro07097 [Rhodococcus jostii RHA1]|uniref:Uncharacterized protein n=1 Tax=Rhodococcus jostii (strain RHA1) TaxID=101510 RepID=Q0S0S5_RHOJR|nr:hypothetical protein RHA1_ro07097 [Rhodococcus jostii RHA1]